MDIDDDNDMVEEVEEDDPLDGTIEEEVMQEMVSLMPPATKKELAYQANHDRAANLTEI